MSRALSSTSDRSPMSYRCASRRNAGISCSELSKAGEVPIGAEQFADSVDIEAVEVDALPLAERLLEAYLGVRINALTSRKFLGSGVLGSVFFVSHFSKLLFLGESVMIPQNCLRGSTGSSPTRYPSPYAIF